MRYVPIVVTLLIISCVLPNAAQGDVYVNALEAHFNNARSIQDVRVLAKETLIRKGLPLGSQEEFESRVAQKALELKKQNPSFSDQMATEMAQVLVGETFGVRSISYQTSGVRNGSRYRVQRTPIESWIVPFGAEKRSVGEGNSFVIVQRGMIALEYRESPPAVENIRGMNTGVLSGRAITWGRLFNCAMMIEMDGWDPSASFDDFKAALDRKGFSFLSEDPTSVVIGTPTANITLDKSHDMLIRDVIQYRVSPDNTKYISYHLVNSEFTKASGQWFPRKSVVERFAWDKISRTGMSTEQLITEFEKIEVNCGVSEEELDFLVPANTKLTARSKDERIAMFALPYSVKTPTLFSKLESDLRPTKDVEDRVVSEALLTLDTVDQGGEERVTTNNKTSLGLESEVRQPVSEIRSPGVPNAVLPSSNNAYISRTDLIVSILLLFVVAGVAVGTFLYKRKGRKF